MSFPSQSGSSFSELPETSRVRSVTQSARSGGRLGSSRSHRLRLHRLENLAEKSGGRISLGVCGRPSWYNRPAQDQQNSIWHSAQMVFWDGNSPTARQPGTPTSSAPCVEYCGVCWLHSCSQFQQPEPIRKVVLNFQKYTRPGSCLKRKSKVVLPDRVCSRAPPRSTALVLRVPSAQTGGHCY